VSSAKNGCFIGGSRSGPSTAWSKHACSSSALVWNAKYTVWTATPARAAMSLIRAPTYPASEKTSIAARITRSRVAAACSRLVRFGVLTAFATRPKLAVVVH
jgi:hypothetical protein